MTAIVAVQDRDRVVMGGDSAITDDGGGQIVIRDPKVFRLGGYLVGVAGGVAWGDELIWLTWPADPCDLWVRREMIAAHRAACRASGVSYDDSDSDGEAVIAGGGHLWVYHSGAVTRPADDYAVAGMGGIVAQGALWASRDYPPRVRARMALEAAARYCSSVRPPFRYLSRGH